MAKTDIFWTPRAEQDLRGVHAYISADSPRQAVAFLRRLKAAVDPLRTFPELGQIVPEMGDPDVREIRLGHYRIIYRFGSGRIEVLTVHHGARVLPSDPQQENDPNS